MSTLKISTTAGAAASGGTGTSWPSLSRPTGAGTSSGEGSRSQTASSTGCTPLLRRAEPQNTGVTARLRVARRRAARTSSRLYSPPR